MDQQGNNFIKSVRDNWVILVFLVSVVVTWTKFIQADSLADARLIKVEGITQSQMVSQAQIMTQLSQIQTDLSWIKIQLK